MRLRLLPALVLSAFLTWAASSGCTFSKSYFRIGPDGKMIKADGPITAQELAGNTSPQGDAAGAVTGGEAPPTTGGDEPITPQENTGGTGTGTATGDLTPEGGNGTAGLAAPTLTLRQASNIYRRPDFSFVYVSVDRATKKTELYLKTSAPDSTPKKLTNMNIEYEQDPRPSVSTDNLSVLFTHTSDWPQMYRITGLDQSEPAVAKWALATGSAASFFPDKDKVVFIAPMGVSLRMAKYDGTEENEESEKDVGVYYGASVNPTIDKGNPFYGKIVFSFDHDEDKPDKPALFVKDSGVVYPFLFKALTHSPTVSETWPSISPDGKRVAYIRDGYLALCDLHQDEKQNPVCDNAFAFVGLTADTPCWTADGSRIVFSTKKDGNAEIYSVAAANAQELENLTNSPDTDDVQPACFPNQILTVKTNFELPANPVQKPLPLDWNQFNTIKK